MTPGLDISRNQNGGRGFTVDQFAAFKAAGFPLQIVKLGGSNNDKYGPPSFYLELVHQDNARAAGCEVAHYWANGQQGTPVEIAKRIVASGQVRAGEKFAWDVETWPNEAREWTPAEVRDRAVALAAEPGGTPATDQVVYLSLALLRKYDWKPVVDLGVLLWVAAWDQGPCLVRHWRRGGVWLRQYTSSSNAELRKIYNADLDLNRPPTDVWTVEELQEALTARGYDVGPIDNDYGRRVTAGVRAFQEDNDLVPDGDAGTRTLTKLGVVSPALTSGG